MDAKQHLQKAIELDANYADAYYELGPIIKKRWGFRRGFGSFSKSL
jgi:hypothetical protein